MKLTFILLSAMSLFGFLARAEPLALGSKAPVIFMTAFDDEATRQEAVAAGCIAYLQKPFPAASLIGAITKTG